jgi:hypothetical protein
MGMETTHMKFRFQLDADNSCFKVKAKLKATGDWIQIGTCHLQSRDAIKEGAVELIQFNVERGDKQ